MDMACPGGLSVRRLHRERSQPCALALPDFKDNLAFKIERK